MAATVRDVARKAGVSAMTVSRVINGQSGVSVETRARIEAAIAELDYAPSKVASSLISSKTELIGMIVPDVSNPFFGPVVRGAETTARKAGYRLLLCNSESDLRLERDYVTDLVAHRVEGLLIAPVGDRSEVSLRRLVEGSFPIVLLDRTIADLSCDSVTLDNADGARRMVAHLVAVGHRSIAFVTDADDVSTGRQRLAGFKEGLANGGIPFSDDLVFHTSTDQMGGYRAAQQILALNERPSAIFAVNNMTAVGVMQALRQVNLRVPDDISLVCFDDVQHLAVISPFLTVVDQPAETMARVAMQLLLERIAGNAGKQARSVSFPGTLVVREFLWSKIGSARFSVTSASKTAQGPADVVLVEMTSATRSPVAASVLPKGAHSTVCIRLSGVNRPTTRRASPPARHQCTGIGAWGGSPEQRIIHAPRRVVFCPTSRSCLCPRRAGAGADTALYRGVVRRRHRRALPARDRRSLRHDPGDQQARRRATMAGGRGGYRQGAALVLDSRRDATSAASRRRGRASPTRSSVVWCSTRVRNRYRTTCPTCCKRSSSTCPTIIEPNERPAIRPAFRSATADIRCGA